MPSPHHSSTHRRSNRGNASIKSVREYRVTATWPDSTGRPLQFGTPDKARARKVGRGHANTGAYVVIEEHVQFGTWRTVQEIDGPAIAAERDAAAELAAAGWPPVPPAFSPDSPKRTRWWLECMQARAKGERRAAEARRGLAAEIRQQARELMQQPDHVLPAAGQRARHTTGGRR